MPRQLETPHPPISAPGDYRTDSVFAPRRLHPGRHGLPQATVIAHQRNRIVIGVAQAVAAHGLLKLSVCRIIASAGVSRRTFYENFKDKYDCLEYARRLALNALLGAAQDAYSQPGPWIEQVRGALHAIAQVIADEPLLARLCFIDSSGMTPGATACRKELSDGLVALLGGWRDATQTGSSDLGLSREEFAAAGILAILSEHLQMDEPRPLGDLLDDLVEVAVRPLPRVVARPAKQTTPTR